MRLSAVISELRDQGHLIEVGHRVDPVHEMAAHVAGSGGWPILFHQVGQARFPIFYNLYGQPGWVARRIGTEPGGIVRALFDACEHPVPSVARDCRHDVVSQGAVDLVKWVPMGQDYARQPVPYLNAGIIFVKDPESGLVNASMHSLNLVASDRVVVHVQAQHFAHVFAKWHRLGKPMPIAVAIGVDPAVWLACALAVEHPPTELEVAGGLAGAVPVMKCATIDLEVPAECEILLEGHVLLNQHGPGGPETLPSRQYSATYHGPVVEIHRVSAYSDAVAHGLLNASPDHLNVMHWLKEFQILRHIQASGFGGKVRAVKVSPAGCDWMSAAVALERDYAGEARTLIDSLLSAKLALGGLRRVIVVDTDVDIGDPAAIDWAVATRVRPDEDLVVVKTETGRGPDPLARRGPVAKLGMDATLPPGGEADFAMPAVGWSEALELPRQMPPLPRAAAQLLKG